MKKIAILCFAALFMGGCDDNSTGNQDSSQNSLLYSSSEIASVEADVSSSSAEAVGELSSSLESVAEVSSSSSESALSSSQEVFSGVVVSEKGVSEEYIAEACYSGVVFYTDSVRCGGYRGFTAVHSDSDNVFSALGFFLYGDSTTANDSIWFYQNPTIGASVIDSIKLHPSNFSELFKLKVLDESVKRESVWDFLDEKVKENRSYEGIFLVYKKSTYTAFCNFYQSSCEVDYSCVIQRNGSFNFSKIPSVEEVNLRSINCPT